MTTPTLSTEDNSVIHSNSDENTQASNEEFDSLPSLTVSYGVDWSTSARPSSHCWFPFTCNEASTTQSCEYVSCTEQKLTDQSTILQCGSCALTVHSHHWDDLESLPPCRPSFIDNTKSKDSSSKYDEHFWSHVSVLSTPCEHCERTSMGNTLFGSGFNPLLAASPSEFLDQVTSIFSSISENFSPKMSKSSDGLVCLWCSRSYHQSCWEQLTDDDKKIQCDYGIFR
jgi:hypothetical protein